MRTSVSSVLYNQEWDRKAIMEYQRASQFSAYIGKGANNPIVYRNMEAITDNIPFVPDIAGSFVNGENRLKGAETAMQSYHEQVTAEWLRKAVEYSKRTVSFTAFDVRSSAKDSVTNFYKNAMRTRIIDAGLSIRTTTAAAAAIPYGLITPGTNGPEITAANSGGAVVTTIEGVNTATSTAANNNSWLALNSDRVLYGSLVANSSSLNHATSLGNVDTTDDTPRASQISLLKRMAKLASPRINPFKIGEGGTEWYLYMVGSRGFRDLQADPEIRQADLEARERGLSNPVFTGGELLYNGVIIKEVEEMPVITAVGAASADVGVGYLLGNQAIAYGVFQEMQSIADTSDYEFIKGIGTESCDTFKKMFWNGKQHGVVNHFFAASPDA